MAGMLQVITYLLAVYLVAASPIICHAEIVAASGPQKEVIQTLANKDVAPIAFCAVKSAQHKQAYYVGMSFSVTGVATPQIGIWIISGTPEKPGMALAVDGFAQNFSRATPADRTNPPTAYVTDSECAEIRRYLRGPK